MENLGNESLTSKMHDDIKTIGHTQITMMMVMYVTAILVGLGTLTIAVVAVINTVHHW